MQSWTEAYFSKGHGSNPTGFYRFCSSPRRISRYKRSKWRKFEGFRSSLESNWLSFRDWRQVEYLERHFSTVSFSQSKMIKTFPNNLLPMKNYCHFVNLNILRHLALALGEIGSGDYREFISHLQMLKFHLKLIFRLIRTKNLISTITFLVMNIKLFKFVFSDLSVIYSLFVMI